MDQTTATILDAATAVFGQRGFSGATMRAIAEAAGVSRPTVYARYKNKEDAFRAVYQSNFDVALANARAALGTEQPLSVRLGGALEGFFGHIFSAMMALEQAQELLTHQERLAGDIVARAYGALRDALLDALRPHGPALDGASPAAMVELMLMAPSSLKGPDRDMDKFRARLRLLGRLVAHAVGAP